MHKKLANIMLSCVFIVAALTAFAKNNQELNQLENGQLELKQKIDNISEGKISEALEKQKAESERKAYRALVNESLKEKPSIEKIKNMYSKGIILELPNLINTKGPEILALHEEQVFIKRDAISLGNRCDGRIIVAEGMFRTGNNIENIDILFKNYLDTKSDRMPLECEGKDSLDLFYAIADADSATIKRYLESASPKTQIVIARALVRLHNAHIDLWNMNDEYDNVFGNTTANELIMTAFKNEDAAGQFYFKIRSGAKLPGSFYHWFPKSLKRMMPANLSKEEKGVIAAMVMQYDKNYEGGMKQLVKEMVSYNDDISFRPFACISSDEGYNICALIITGTNAAKLDISGISDDIANSYSNKKLNLEKRNNLRKLLNLIDGKPEGAIRTFRDCVDGVCRIFAD